MARLTEWLSGESKTYKVLTGDSFTRAEAIRANMGVAMFMLLLLLASMLD